MEGDPLEGYVMKLFWVIAALCCAPLLAQEDRPVRYFPNDPPAPGCSVITPIWNNWNNGNVWHCVGASGVNNGTWELFTGGAAIPHVTGALKGDGTGNAAAVTGSPTNCVLVDGASGPCGGSSACIQDLGTITTAPLIDGGSNCTIKTLHMTLGANITCGTIQNFISGEGLLLSINQDPTGGRTFACSGMTDLVIVAIQALKSTKQYFVAVTSSSLDSGGAPPWCPDCTPAGPVIPASSGGGSLLITAGAGGANATLVFPVLNFDFTASGCTSCVIFQTSAGGTFTVAKAAFTDLNGSAACGQLPAFTGDTISSGCATVTGKINGGSVPISATVLGSNGSAQPVAASLQGNGSKVQLSTGSTVTNDCVKFDANGNTVDSGGTCGGGGGSPISSVLYPFGGVASSFAVATIALGTAHKTIFFEIFLPSPGIILANLSAYLNASTPGNVNWAVYDSTCTLLTNGAAITVPATANVVNNWVFSPTLSLTGGKYFLALTGDTTTMQMFAPGDSVKSDIANANEGAGNFHIFTGTASTGTSTLVFPGTCGTRSAYGSGNPVTPAVALH